MSGKQILAILAVVAQVGNLALLNFSNAIPPKYAAVIAGVVGIIQSALPRVQGSDASDVKKT